MSSIGLGQIKKVGYFSDWTKNLRERRTLPMSKCIPNLDGANQLENAIRQFVKEQLELIIGKKSRVNRRKLRIEETAIIIET